MITIAVRLLVFHYLLLTSVTKSRQLKTGFLNNEPKDYPVNTDNETYIGNTLSRVELITIVNDTRQNIPELEHTISEKYPIDRKDGKRSCVTVNVNNKNTLAYSNQSDTTIGAEGSSFSIQTSSAINITSTPFSEEHNEKGAVKNQSSLLSISTSIEKPSKANYTLSDSISTSKKKSSKSNYTKPVIDDDYDEAVDEFLFGNGECAKRWYSIESYVCVCNTDVCEEMPKQEKLKEGQYAWYSSAMFGLRLHKTIQLIKRGIAKNAFTVNSEKKYQTILGFGGAFNDATGINILKMPQKLQDKILDAYFGERGLRYSLGRVPMGANDFSLSQCSPLSQEKNISEFHLCDEDIKYQIPIIQKAMNLTENKLKLMGSTWSAPDWMKENINNTVGGKLKDEYDDLWSHYQIKFLDEYAKNGIKFWAITTGNEPINKDHYRETSINNRMSWSPYHQRHWVADHLIPSLNTSAYKDVQIFMFDEYLAHPYIIDWFFENQDPKLIDQKLHEVYNHIQGIAIHWYLPMMPFIDMLNTIHSKYPDKTIVTTNTRLVTHKHARFARLYNRIPLGSWQTAENSAIAIIKNFNRWSSGWIDQNMVLDEHGGPNQLNQTNDFNGGIIVNMTSNEFYKQPVYYAIGHFSVFIPPGSRRIDITPELINGVYATAAQTPDGKNVIVFCNTKTRSTIVSFNIGGNRTITARAYFDSINTIVY